MTFTEFFSRQFYEPYIILMIRLVVACILGGIIGYEREHMQRPAGFRTHILVCVGAALVMVTSEFIFKKYTGQANIDPARLGAQVISGIGFLGAGTIIREGFSVKGLTTAASLWAVSCVGIAAGIGFYEGAVAATVLIYVTLILLRRVENHTAERNLYKVIYVQVDNGMERVGTVSDIFGKYNAPIRSIEFIEDGDGKSTTIKLLAVFHGTKARESIQSEIMGLEGIKKVYEG